MFPVIAYVERVVTVLRFSSKRAKALAEASHSGQSGGQRAVMSPLVTEDQDVVQDFIEAMP